MRGGDRGAAVAEFVLVMVLLVPLVLGIAQVALVLHVRNTLAAAASEGARAATPLGASPSDGAARARELIRAALADRYARDVRSGWTDVDGVAGTEVRISAEVPALGLFGPTVSVSVSGHAVRQVEP